MKLSTREDIEAPIAYVFQRVSDFERFERRAMRQGADVSRRAEGLVEIGMIWDIAFEFRGRSLGGGKDAAHLLPFPEPGDLDLAAGVGRPLRPRAGHPAGARGPLLRGRGRVRSKQGVATRPKSRDHRVPQRPSS